MNSSSNEASALNMFSALRFMQHRLYYQSDVTDRITSDKGKKLLELLIQGVDLIDNDDTNKILKKSSKELLESFLSLLPNDRWIDLKIRIRILRDDI